MDYLEIAVKAVQLAQKIGAYAAEAYVLDARALTIEVAEQKVETLKQANDTGIGIRVISREQAVGFAHCTGIDSGDIEGVVRQALANSRKSFADRYHFLPGKPQQIPEMDLLDRQLALASVEEKIEKAKEVERAAQRTDKRVRRTERCVYEDADYGVALANSNGLAVAYRSGYCGVYGMVLAEQDGDVQTGMALSYRRRFAELDPAAVGSEAAREAVMLLGAKTIGTTKAALVLSPYIATNFFSILIPALSADAVQKGRSLFKGKLGQKVASPVLSLVDDGRLEGGIASSPVDGEGVLTRRTELVVRGELKNYLYNTYTAAKDNVASTGNGVRGSFKGLPEVGPTNIFIQPGDTEPNAIIAGVRKGFYVTNVMGMHTANPISGDFSIGAAGVWIENGEFTHAVRGVAIAGNILELLNNVDAVGSDLRFFGSQGAPTLRISGITISGS
ncbi:peptidase U62, modulator of DNA gyrase [Thermosinus carboxydivorans Nor1]|uniref:Peptidase U62, modulator of DNA gyrase n=1 Tax=Thermosinus carboxydivorans Nor1 TaxID=401526 RepID=A1HQ83_9FIRM|nr:TldD/PmbA family protein [Thermosinus carboxydivorans]EAX47930.1 peptidase U62, modulator of DNA gyrase [Thermosinus carboxydivorans Nor1]